MVSADINLIYDDGAATAAVSKASPHSGSTRCCDEVKV